MQQSSNHETTPGELLTNFSGRSLKSMIVFTVVAHIVLLVGPSTSYIWRLVTGADTSKMSESERVELAVKETQTAMRRIAEQHGIKPQDLGNQFAAPAPAAKPPADAQATGKTPAAEPKTAPKTAPPPAPEKPQSAIEKEINKVVPGPAVPGAGDEDLFK